MLFTVLRRVMLGLVMLLAAPVDSRAADIEVPDEGLCDIRISGEILPGDYARFMALRNV